MRDFTTWQRLVGLWGDRTFPGHYASDGTPQPRGCANHLIEEAGELVDAVEHGGNVGEECADVVILALSIAHLMGFDLGAFVEAKMRVNRARRWGEPDALGVYHAEKGATQSQS